MYNKTKFTKKSGKKAEFRSNKPLEERVFSFHGWRQHMRTVRLGEHKLVNSPGWFSYSQTEPWSPDGKVAKTTKATKDKTATMSELKAVLTAILAKM